jgi:exodeoxyribonuclease III
MTLNIGVGGENVGRPIGDMVAVVRASGADVVGLQETIGSEVHGVRPDGGQKLADLLGWNYLAQPGGCGVLTRFPIVRASPHKHGALLRTNAGRAVWLFNTHLAHAPYQPYQLLGIPYAGAPNLSTAAEAVAAARAARGAQVEAVLADIRAASDVPGQTIIVTGDFNEPSHLDWTDAATQAGRCPLPVPFPSAKALTDAGFVDAYRAIHPDPVARPGHTWTPMTDPTDPADRHDRIDFVLVRGAAVEDAVVVGERAPAADLVVNPWPTDHRAVLAVLRLSNGATRH